MNIYEKSGIENITEAYRNIYLELYLKSDDKESIIITGADRNSLQKAGKVLEDYCKRIDTGKNISVMLMDNIEECCCVNTDAKVISLSDGGALFINQNTQYEADVISAKELCNFIDLSKMEKVDEDIVATWSSLFEYEMVAFCTSNKCIDELAKILRL